MVWLTQAWAHLHVLLFNVARQEADGAAHIQVVSEPRRVLEMK